jgi:hypothetical protein
MTLYVLSTRGVPIDIYDAPDVLIPLIATKYILISLSGEANCRRFDKSYHL